MQTVFLPLLADWDAVVPVVFFLIAFSSWIANFLKENKAGAGKKPVRPGQRPAGSSRAKTIQEQIETFLRQAREQAEAASSPPTASRPPGEVEVVRQSPEAPRRRAPSEKASRRRTRRTRRNSESGQLSGQQNTSPAAETREQRGVSSRPGDDMAQRHLSGTLNPRQGSQDLGRLSTSTFNQQVSRDVDSSIRQGISSHLGTFQAGLATSSGESAIAETRATRETAASRVADMMRSRQTVRDALIISEILRKPRALS